MTRRVFFSKSGKLRLMEDFRVEADTQFPLGNATTDLDSIRSREQICERCRDSEENRVHCADYGTIVIEPRTGEKN
jgi:hypothetical protein